MELPVAGVARSAAAGRQVATAAWPEAAAVGAGVVRAEGRLETGVAAGALGAERRTLRAGREAGSGGAGREAPVAASASAREDP